METEKLTYSVEEAGKLLGISRPLAYKLACTGKLPVIRFGKRILVSRKALEDMLASAGKAVQS